MYAVQFVRCYEVVEELPSWAFYSALFFQLTNFDKICDPLKKWRAILLFNGLFEHPQDIEKICDHVRHVTFFLKWGAIHLCNGLSKRHLQVPCLCLSKRHLRKCLACAFDSQVTPLYHEWGRLIILQLRALMEVKTVTNHTAVKKLNINLEVVE